MAKKMDRKNKRPVVHTEYVAAMPKKHPVRKSLAKRHVPADLRALGVTNMKDFVTG